MGTQLCTLRTLGECPICIEMHLLWFLFSSMCLLFIRWIDLYGEEICEASTHISKKPTDGPATVTYAMDSQRTQPVEVMKSFNNLHGAGFVRESLRGVPPAPGSVGLHNLGNSCYMNSILQCVNHISPITQYFLKGEYTKHINKNNPLGSGGRVGEHIVLLCLAVA